MALFGCPFDLNDDGELDLSEQILEFMFLTEVLDDENDDSQSFDDDDGDDDCDGDDEY